MDSSAVIAAALQAATSRVEPLFVRAFQFSGRAARDPSRLDTLVLGAAISTKREAISRPPSAIQDRDPKIQSLLDDVAWLPWIMRFRGSVGIDSLAFESSSMARLRYSLTSFEEPKPSRPVIAIRWLVLRRGASNAWSVESDNLEAILDGQPYSFSLPDMVPDLRLRHFVEESRAALRKRGVVLP